jgi:hypothetical protein
VYVQNNVYVQHDIRNHVDNTSIEERFKTHLTKDTVQRTEFYNTNLNR